MAAIPFQPQHYRSLLTLEGNGGLEMGCIPRWLGLRNGSIRRGKSR